MMQQFEFTMTVFAPQGIDPNLAVDVAVRAIGELGYMVDITHKLLDCTAAVAEAVAEEREAIIQMMDNWTREWPMTHARGLCRDIAVRIRARTSSRNGGGEEGNDG